MNGKITRYGTSSGLNDKPLPFAKAVQAGDFLFVSGQTPMIDGEVIAGNIVTQSRVVLNNLKAIIEQAGFSIKDVVRCGVWLDDPRDFDGFNRVFNEYFIDNAPARSLVQSRMVIDCKVEVDCICYKSK